MIFWERLRFDLHSEWKQGLKSLLKYCPAKTEMVNRSGIKLKAIQNYS